MHLLRGSLLRFSIVGFSLASGLALPLGAVQQAVSLDLTQLPPPPTLEPPIGPPVRTPGLKRLPTPAVTQPRLKPATSGSAPDLTQLPPPPQLDLEQLPPPPPSSQPLSLAGCPAGDAEAELKLTASSPYLPMLRRTWVAYRDRFITPEGLVIDLQAEDKRTTSEGQAYAMLRAVLINDRELFDRTLNWAEQNLARSQDSLWAWKWLPDQGIASRTFATDADIDAVTALILAARRWDCPAYLNLARQKLDDIWRYSVVEANGNHYLLPGPAESFYQTPDEMILNPSYFAPYAYRMFAQVDDRHDWLKLVTDSYEALDAIAAVSEKRLPGDWIQLDTTTGQFGPISRERNNIKSIYSFDAFRVWWRVGLDAAWFDAPRAKAYLRKNMVYLTELWQTEQRIPGIMNLAGEAQVEWETTSHYAALYPAFKHVDRDIAFEIFTQKLLQQYEGGFWENDTTYYAQNLAWFSLLPPLQFDLAQAPN